MAFRNSIPDEKSGDQHAAMLRHLLKESDKTRFDAFLLQANEKKDDPLEEEFEIISHNQELMKIVIRKYLLQEHEHILLGTISGDYNISTLGVELERQRSLKDDLKNDLEQQSELSEMKSRFLSIASHEFRTPLAGILSSLNLIDRYIHADLSAWSNFKSGDKVINHLNKISESVRNLTAIINKFLALGNIEKGEIPVKLTRINLPRILKTQISQIQEISKPGQRIEYAHTGVDKIIMSDKYLLRNIIINMLSNAIKFSPENSCIEVRSEIGKESVKLVISDQGIGIPEAEQDKIFSRFYRAKNVLHDEEGTGLGLNIVKKYVELMGGSIALESELNEGTTFYIDFPRTKS